MICPKLLVTVMKLTSEEKAKMSGMGEQCHDKSFMPNFNGTCDF